MRKKKYPLYWHFLGQFGIKRNIPGSCFIMASILGMTSTTRTKRCTTELVLGSCSTLISNWRSASQNQAQTATNIVEENQHGKRAKDEIDLWQLSSQAHKTRLGTSQTAKYSIESPTGKLPLLFLCSSVVFPPSWLHPQFLNGTA